MLLSNPLLIPSAVVVGEEGDLLLGSAPGVGNWEVSQCLIPYYLPPYPVSGVVGHAIDRCTTSFVVGRSQIADKKID